MVLEHGTLAVSSAARVQGLVVLRDQSLIEAKGVLDYTTNKIEPL